jgi:hypothetical protein
VADVNVRRAATTMIITSEAPLPLVRHSGQTLARPLTAGEV